MNKNIINGNKILEYFTSFLMGLLTFIIFFQILNRFMLHIPMSWTEEASRYTFIWLCLFGTLKAYQNGTHIRISFLVHGLTQRKKCIIDLIGDFFILNFSVLLAWTGFIYTKSAIHRSWEFGQVSIMPVYAVLPIVGILLFYQGIKKIRQGFNNLKSLNN